MPSRHYLTACLCFKNAASYLAEWLAFYTALGVERFYLYDNESTDNFAEPLAPYLSRGTVTLISHPGRAIQKAVYAHCLKTFGAGSRWMMFCDDDEFLFPTKDVPLPEALAPYEKFAGVAVSWMLYGASGHRTRPPGLVIENYTQRFAVPDQHVKCIVDPARIVGPVLIAHEFQCVDGEVVVNENGEPMAGPFSQRPTADILRINHYLTKSHDELIARRKRIQANTGEISSLAIDEWLRLEAGWNQVEDRIALRYVERINALRPGGIGGSVYASS